MRRAFIFKRILELSLALVLVALISACSGVQPRYHQVQKGETKEKIALKYGIALVDLHRFNEGIEKGIRVGDKIYIPFETIPGWNEEQEPEDDSPDSDAAVLMAKNGKRGRNLSSLAPRFSWPVFGSLSSAFGKRQGEAHDGIDIAAPKGTMVFASRSGHVIYATNKIAGYGNMVIVRHPDTFATVYAHLSVVLVEKGQVIRMNQHIGKVMTDDDGKAVLQFQIWEGQEKQNPQSWLRGR